MKVTKEELSKIKIALTIEVEEERFEAAVAQAFKENAHKVRVDGFRKGKAPRKMIERVYGKEVFYNEALEILVPQVYNEALEADDTLRPISQPEMEIVTLEDGKPFVFKATFEVEQDIQLGEYKGIELEKIAIDVTDAEVDAYIENVRDKYAQLVVAEDETVKEGDIINLDFCGKQDGVAFPGGTAKDYPLEIGSHTFIPGFEEQMIGMKKGESKDLNLTFPEDYHEKTLAGAAVVFEVKVNEVKRRVFAEIDDEFAKDVSVYETLAEYKASVKEELLQGKETDANNQYKTSIVNKVVEDSDVVAPEYAVAIEAENMEREWEYTMEQQHITKEQYFQATGLSEEIMQIMTHQRAESYVKQRLVLDAIAKKENIDVTTEEVEAEFKKMAEAYNQSVEEIKKVFGEEGTVIKSNLILAKTMDMLLENAKIG